MKIKSIDHAANDNPLFAWHANLVTVNRRKALILINDEYRYPILLYGLKAPNFKALDTVITRGIREFMYAEGISPEIVDKYLKAAGTVVFTETANRSIVGQMNQASQDVGYYSDELELEHLCQPDFSLRLGSYPTKVGNEYQKPKELLLTALEQFANNDDLHSVIQDAFGWLNYHLYEFTVFESRRPVALIVCDEEALAGPDYRECPKLLDNKARLKDAHH
ncbi:MAG TPA: plasmid pRiA4b ORF-3 family protein [Firmicutes bacterium]|nr:plasmid pRiA4b ORF-3 family protein [Bacillota bacterium]